MVGPVIGVFSADVTGAVTGILGTAFVGAVTGVLTTVCAGAVTRIAFFVVDTGVDMVIVIFVGRLEVSATALAFLVVDVVDVVFFVIATVDETSLTVDTSSSLVLFTSSFLTVFVSRIRPETRGLEATNPLYQKKL